MTLTDEQIEEIKARVEAATPGPWQQEGPRVYFGYEGGISLHAAPNPINNSHFIAHARTDIPLLISAIEAEKKRADEAEARRKCYECGSEMTACARCNPELPTAELTALSARVAELEAALKLAAEMLTKASLCYAERIDEGLSVIRRALKGGVSEPSAPSEWQKRGPDFNEWEIEWERFAAMLADAKGEYFWMYDGALKYLNIRLDTRSNAFILRDRDDNRIDPARVEAAIRQCRDMRGGVVKIDRDGRRAHEGDPNG